MGTHRVITRVARELRVGAESLRSWVRQAEIDSGPRGGTTSADAQRIAALEREVRELRRANDVADSTCQRRPPFSERSPGATSLSSAYHLARPLMGTSGISKSGV